MYLSDEEKSVLLAIYKAGISTEKIVDNLPASVVRSLSAKGAIRAKFKSDDEVLDVILLREGKDYIKNNPPR